MDTTIEQVQEELLILQNKVKTYNNLDKKIQDNYRRIEEQREELRWIEENITRANIEQERIEGENRWLELQIIWNNQEREQKQEELEKLKRHIDEASEYLVRLDKWKIEKEQELQELEKDRIKQTEKLEKELLEIEKEHKVRLSRIQDEVNKKQELLNNIQKDVEDKQQLQKDREDGYNKANLELREVTNVIKWLQEEEKRLIKKNGILKRELDEMLKQCKDMATKHKIVKSWTSRLDYINKQFKS